MDDAPGDSPLVPIFVNILMSRPSIGAFDKENTTTVR